MPIMHLRVTEKIRGKIDFSIVYGGIAVMCLLAARYLPITDILPPCAFRTICGIPCPTCGVTRSLIELARGNICASLSMNPLAAVIFSAATVYCLYSVLSFLICTRRIRCFLSDREKVGVRFAAILIVLVNWCYLIRSR